MCIFAPQKAQMAESVDALVSNTSGATRAGSTPALGTSSTHTTIAKPLKTRGLAIFIFLFSPQFPHICKNSCKVSFIFSTRKVRIREEKVDSLPE